MSSAPPRPPLTEREVFVATCILYRLMTRHGLDASSAQAAALSAVRGTDSEHADLARQELDAVIEEAARTTRTLAQFMTALREQFARMEPVIARTLAALRHSLENLSTHPAAPHDTRPGTRTRPAWQSPYGPPTRRRTHR